MKRYRKKTIESKNLKEINLKAVILFDRGWETKEPLRVVGFFRPRYRVVLKREIKS